MYAELIRKLALISTLVAIVFGITMSWIGLIHNPQLEFNDPLTGAINYQYLFLFFLSWFIPVFIITFICISILYIFVEYCHLVIFGSNRFTKNTRTIIKIVIGATTLVVLFFYLKSVAVRFLGHIPNPYPKGPIVVNEDENICVDFFPLESEYTQSAIKSFHCDKPYEKLDEYFTKRCAVISVKNLQITIKEDWACASGATCDEWQEAHQQCDWKTEIFSINSDGKLIQK